MFEWLENIWNGIKAWCEWFASTVQYGIKGFQLLSDLITYPVTFLQNVNSYLPAFVMPLFMLCLFVTIISLILGRRGN